MSADTERDPVDYFDSAYRDYEGQNPPKKLDHYVDMLEARTRVPDLQLLDIGCGRGRFLQHVGAREPSWRLFGIEPEPSGVTASSALVPEATILEGVADSLPFPSEGFDVVTAWDVLEHVPDPRAALLEVKRCLRPGGVLGVVVPVYDSVTGPLIRALDRDPTHIHKESRDFWLRLIGEHFGAIEWHGIYRYLLGTSRYLHRPTRRLRRATPAVFISAIRD